MLLLLLLLVIACTAWKCMIGESCDSLTDSHVMPFMLLLRPLLLPLLLLQLNHAGPGSA
jgi:hypothetical protein